MNPTVDVIIATYNRASTVGRAIESALAQDYEPVRVIVVDDGSTDDTEQVLAAYEGRVTVIRQENQERGAARNTGLRAGTGELVLFLDSDDELKKGAIGHLVDALVTRPEVGLAYTEAEFFDDEAREVFDVFPRTPVEGDVFALSATRNLMVIDSVLVRRRLLDEVGGFCEDRSLSGMEDWELWTRCLARSAVAFVPIRGVTVHFHALNTIGNPVQMERAILTASDKILSNSITGPRLQTRRVESRAAVYALIAHHHMLSGDTRAARRSVLHGMREEPRVVTHRVFVSMAVKALVGSRGLAILREARRARYLRGRAA